MRPVARASGVSGITRREFGRSALLAWLTVASGQQSGDAASLPTGRADTARWRADFPMLDQYVNGHPLAYLDNAATTQRPTAVLQAIMDYYHQNNANPGSALRARGGFGMNRIAILTAGVAAMALSTSAPASNIDWARVDQAIGKKGSDQPGGVHKYGLPRSDLTVTVDGVLIRPALALGSWVAFQPTGDGAMCMGDLVLTDTEISPVMQSLVEHGVEITAVHNHLLRTSIPVFYMHVGGHGDPVKLAAALHAALSLSNTPLSQAPAAAATPPELDTAAIEKTLRYKGAANGGVYQFSIPRAEALTEGGMVVPPSMGTAIAINFEPTTAGKAAISGDFVLLGTEVNPVLKTLRQNGIEVTALHSHMIDDSPRLFFMHFWANDDALNLARGLRAALDLANVKPGS